MCWNVEIVYALRFIIFFRKLRQIHLSKFRFQFLLHKVLVLLSSFEMLKLVKTLELCSIFFRAIYFAPFRRKKNYEFWIIIKQLSNDNSICALFLCSRKNFATKIFFLKNELLINIISINVWVKTTIKLFVSKNVNKNN